MGWHIWCLPMTKRPRDANQLAKAIVDLATGEPAIDRPAVNEAQSRGGKIGGKARAASISPARRKEIAKNAAKARWEKETSDA